MNNQIDNNKLPLKCKFSLQAALEKIELIEEADLIVNKKAHTNK